MNPADHATESLDKVVAQLSAGEERSGQREMCHAVATALEQERHLLVEAGTGVGKSLAYLVPAVLSGKRTVIATATKALQDQLVTKDVPFLHEHLGVPFDATVLKGRSNYLCKARLAETVADGTKDSQLRLVPATTIERSLPALTEWATSAEFGERSDLPVDISTLLWDALTVGPAECPGAKRCPHGEACFAELARERALAADIVIVNAHLYCLDLVLDGALLGEHDAVVIDEAHTLEETAASVFGLTIGPGRFSWLASQLRGVLVRDAKEIEATERLASAFGRALEPLSGRRVQPDEGSLATAVTTASQVVASVLTTLRNLKVTDSTESRRLRVLQALDGLARELETLPALPSGHVAWVEGGGSITLRVAPVDVGPLLTERLFAHRTAILTSATLSVGGEVRSTAFSVGLRDRDDYTALRVASPFDYQHQGLLYCPTHLPEPRDDAFLDAAIDELAGLIEAAGGRTLALFTSYRALDAAAEALRERWDWKVLVQDTTFGGGTDRAQLLAEFLDDEQACLFATMAFWQGVDVPGDSLRLVVIDKLPFGRPDEPLTQARREAAEADGRSGFETVDLPRAARLLAQGAGRLIRTTTDRGVVAVLDRRLATARYRAAILRSLPPLRRTVDPDEVREFLASL
ncbi:MAG TPA: ATP-dependent DNA helicase [Acidimicrobiia bacterium]|nr:ATP-dependent DNA helicase [Acidimicrobiia bacterium]